MVTLVVGLLLAGPPIVNSYNKSDACQHQDGSVLQWRLCQPRVINLGSWDPRPLEWPYSTYYEPKEWGEYQTEKRNEKPY